jgi:hypothetical protein
MHNQGVVEAREAAKVLTMLSTMWVPEAYLNDNCLPRAP